MYSIIETTSQDGKKEVSVVRGNWIKNGMVHWPKNYTKAIKKEADPNPDWETFECKILKQNIENYGQAKEKEKFLADFSNSECEGIKTKKRKYNMGDFNENFDRADNFIIVKSLPALTPISNNTELRENGGKRKQKMEEKIRNNKKCIKETKSKISLILENQDRILKNQADIKEVLQVVMNVLPKRKESVILKDATFIIPNFPVTSVEHLASFNSKLSSQSYMDQMTLHLYKLSADKVNKTVRNCLDYLCSGELLTKYSWSGQNSLSKDINKHVFAELINILELLRSVHNYLKAAIAVTTQNIRLSVKEYLKHSNFRNKKKIL